MKRLYLFSLLLTISGLTANAQNFTFTAGDYIEEEAIPGEYTSATSNIENHSDNVVVFKWEMITFENPIGWEFSIHDYTSLYADGQTFGTMTSVIGGSDTAYLQVKVLAETPGTGTYRFVVWDQLLPDDTDTITFVFNSAGTTTTEELSASAISATAPHGANCINIRNNSGEIASYSLYTISGQRIATGNALPQETASIETFSFHNGLYFVAFYHKGELIETEKVVIQ